MNYEDLYRDVLQTNYTREDYKRMVIKLITDNKKLIKTAPQFQRTINQFEKLTWLLEDCLKEFMAALVDQMSKVAEIQQSLAKVRELVYKTHEYLDRTENLVAGMQDVSKRAFLATQRRMLSESVQQLSTLEGKTQEMTEKTRERGKKRDQMQEKANHLKKLFPTYDRAVNSEPSSTRVKFVSRDADGKEIYKMYKKRMCRNVGIPTQNKKPEDASSNQRLIISRKESFPVEKIDSSEKKKVVSPEKEKSSQMQLELSDNSKKNKSISGVRTSPRQRRKRDSPVSTASLRKKRRLEITEASSSEVENCHSTLKGDRLCVVLQDVLKCSSEKSVLSKKTDLPSDCASKEKDVPKEVDDSSEIQQSEVPQESCESNSEIGDYPEESFNSGQESKENIHINGINTEESRGPCTPPGAPVQSDHEDSEQMDVHNTEADSTNDAIPNGVHTSSDTNDSYPRDASETNTMDLESTMANASYDGEAEDKSSEIHGSEGDTFVAVDSDDANEDSDDNDPSKEDSGKGPQTSSPWPEFSRHTRTRGPTTPPGSPPSDSSYD